MKNPLLGNVMTTLHATLFAYEKSLLELIGTRGYKTHVFPEVVDTIKNLDSKAPLIKEVLTSASVYEAMQKWMILLAKAGVVKDGTVFENRDGSYTISIPYCMMHDPIHAQIGDQKGICPMALILIAAASANKKIGEPVIEYSEFHPKGTKTIVSFN